MFVILRGDAVPPGPLSCDYGDYSSCRRQLICTLVNLAPSSRVGADDVTRLLLRAGMRNSKGSRKKIHR